MKNIAVLLSGGVDSSVVVHIRCEQGYRPNLFYIKIGRDDVDYMDCSAEEDLEMCRFIAHKYGLPLDIVDLQKAYWENVAAYAIDKVKRGLTPNPDVMCNKLIKFGCFEERVGKDFDYTAQLGRITQPSLIISGTNDESTPLLAKAMYDGIPNSRWELLDGARHLTFADQPERYVRIVSEWCSDHD